MAVARTTKTRHRNRKARRPQTTRRSAPAAHPSRNAHTEALPGWSDLAKANQRVPGSGSRGTFLEKISTTRFALLIIGIAVLFTLYIGHVHATQDLLADVQQLRRENLQLHLKYNRLKGEFDGMIGPGVIYDRARMLGLEEDPVYGPTITIDE